MIQCRGMWLPDGDTHFRQHLEISPVVAGLGTYQLHKLELAMKHVKQKRVAIDIGAHVGLWACILAMRFDHVHAFEPMPVLRECFIKNVTAENVELHECALGSSEGAVRLKACLANSGNSHVAPDGTILAPMFSLDSFHLADVDFIKIDTEGYELEVLRGAVDTLKRCKPTLIVEQKPLNGSRYGYGDLAALDWLQRHGAKIVAEKARDYVLVW